MLVLLDKTENEKPIRLFNDWVEVMLWSGNNISEENADQYCVSELYWFETIYYKWKYGLKSPDKKK